MRTACRLIPVIVWAISVEALLPFAAGDEPASSPQSLTTEEIEYFETKIRPILVEHCYECHSTEADTIQAGLLLDSRQSMRDGGDSGEVLTPGDVNSSLLLEALRYESLEMPPAGRLPDDVIADFTRWVEMGAPDPREAAAASMATASPLPPSTTIDWQSAQQHWAFQRPETHVSPASADPWVQRTLDAFILDRLRQSGLLPSGPADRRTLIRRVTFDLIGLPPTPEEVAEFETTDDLMAYGRVVERLLASPRYGEHWAALWLDLMRYAEDQAHIVGNNRELCYPNAYLYRDWVISALNDDLPYDQFIRLQLAADLLPDARESDRIALGFLGLGPKYYRRGSPEVMAEEWENQIDTITRGLLGLTVACARCHDHKYDPVSTEDYYGLAGVFAGTEMFNGPRSTDVDRDQNGQVKNPEEAMHIVRDGTPRDLQVMIRGDATNLGPVVPRRFLRVLCPDDPELFSQGESGRRELAEAIVATENPLTARVIVNRVWSWHMGQPLVGTPSNFGVLGDRPTHPELLDDLAARFMENGWSLKWLHREIVLSATYQQSSMSGAKLGTEGPSGCEVDPGNTLLWRMNRKRLRLESWRDAILAVTGSLENSVGGESHDPSDPDERRRTVYAERSRFQLNGMLALFDFPDPNTHAPRRNQTTTPLQKLFIMNSPFLVQQADRLARELTSRLTSDDERIAYAYRLLYARDPTSQELDLGRQFLAEQDGQSWQEYAQALLASNEMLVLD